MTIGLVVSDLHLFSIRSRGIEVLHRALQNEGFPELLVLNGDTFDFNWAGNASYEELFERGVALLRGLLQRYPGISIVYVLGNHDCQPGFVTHLERLSQSSSRFHWHELQVRIVDALFLHGDVCNAPMDQIELRKARVRDALPRPRSSFARLVYQCIIAFRGNRIIHLMHSRKTVADRLTWYLSRLDPALVSGVQQVFFGHTHVPMVWKDSAGVEFINTGSAIRGLGSSFTTFRAENQSCLG